MVEGWIKLYRQLVDWEWYTDANVFRVFLHLLLEANHKDGYWKGKKINRGERVTSYGKLALALGLSKQQIRTALDKLEATGEITRKTTNKYTLINVVNYTNYQCQEEKDTHKSTHKVTSEITLKQHSNNTQITPNKNEKNEKNEKKLLSRHHDNNDSDIFSYIEMQFGRPLRTAEYKQISIMANDYSDELLREAVDRAVLYRALSIKYIQSTLRAWKEKGAETLIDVEKLDKQFEKSKTRKKGKDARVKPVDPSVVPDYYDIYKKREARDG